MKKLFLSTCLALFSIGAFASSRINPTVKSLNATESINLNLLAVAQVKATASFTSTCGVSWSLVSYGSTLGGAMNGLYNLEVACNAACGTNTKLIVVPTSD
jgi:hypothetical protein